MAKFILTFIVLILGTSCWANLKVTMFPVWHGDLIFIELPHGENILVDTGRENMVAKYLEPYLVRENLKIDYLVLTHPHGDHIEGAAGVILNHNLKEVWDNGIQAPRKKPWRLYKEALKKRSVAVYQPRYDDVRRLGEVKFEFFNPSPEKGYNDDSMVFAMTYKDTRFLFTGDAEKDAQRRVISRYKGRIKADVYKVAHHGLKDAYLPLFIDLVQPTLSICPCLPNRPNNKQTKHLEKYGTLLNVKKDGTITVESDGKKVWYTTEV